jgi:hypothetical protein
MISNKKLMIFHFSRMSFESCEIFFNQIQDVAIFRLLSCSSGRDVNYDCRKCFRTTICYLHKNSRGASHHIFQYSLLLFSQSRSISIGFHERSFNAFKTSRPEDEDQNLVKLNCETFPCSNTGD